MHLPAISALFLFTSAISAGMAFYAWQRRVTPGSQPFALFMLAIAVYGLGYAMELSSPDLESALFWSRVQYAGILTFPTMYLVFIIQYIGRGSWLTSRNLSLLFVLPVTFFIIKLFDGSLHLIYFSAQAQIINSTLYLDFVRGPLYLPIAVFQLLMVTIGNILLIQKWRFSSQLYRSQTGILLLAAVIPYLTYLVYLLGIPLSPQLSGIDINPLAYATWAGLAALAIYRYRLLDLAPVARDALIEMLGDGVIVLDSQTRVVDANPAALKILNWQFTPIGEFAETVMKNWLDTGFLKSIKTPTKKEIAQPTGEAAKYYEASVSLLTEDHRQEIGYLIILHDISERKKVETRLQELSLQDDLTGLNNRRGFNVLARQLIEMANRAELNAVLFYIDLDGLKSINDQMGHAAGDQALKDVADTLKSSFRTADVVARLGGDEFVVLALESQENSAAMMLTRLETNIDKNTQLKRSYKLSVSAGQSHYQWKQPKPIEDLIREADKAMYVVKQNRKTANPG
jgi:diguanylate cyclase (GGDEF)-like protein